MKAARINLSQINFPVVRTVTNAPEPAPPARRAVIMDSGRYGFGW